MIKEIDYMFSKPCLWNAINKTNGLYILSGGLINEEIWIMFSTYFRSSIRVKIFKK